MKNFGIDDSNKKNRHLRKIVSLILMGQHPPAVGISVGGMDHSSKIRQRPHPLECPTHKGWGDINLKGRYINASCEAFVNLSIWGRREGPL